MILTIAGKTYAQTDAEAIDSLFTSAQTCAGFWRKQGRGILLMDLQRKPFAYAARDGYSAFFVTAHADETAGGRTRYMFGLGEWSAKQLGIDGLRYSAQGDTARQAIMDAHQSPTWPPATA